jgi:two-component system cell cycle sensor histidine kinase/response regulator CckA
VAAWGVAQTVTTLATAWDSGCGPNDRTSVAGNSVAFDISSSQPDAKARSRFDVTPEQSTAPLHVLLLEDSAADAELILHELRRGGFELVARRVASRGEMLEALDDGSWKLVLLDYSLEGGGTALDALALLAERNVDLPAILISGVIGEEEAADALRAGARDFVNKGNLTRLVPAVARELDQVEARRRRREGDEELRLSEQRLRLALDAGGMGSWRWDLVSGRLEWSGKLERMFGLEPGAFGGTYAEFIGLVHPDDRELVGASVEEAVEHDSPAVVYRAVWPDGSTHWHERKSQRVRDADGLFQVMAGITFDVTEREEAARGRELLEDELRQAQKMEAVGQLAGGIAHDFNNLLTVISGYTEILLRRLGRDGEGAKEIAEINKAAERAAQLTGQLLAYSRKQVLESRPLDLNHVVAETETMLKRLIGENIELSTARAEKLGCISADDGQIEQIIMNLVVNARDAMPDGGTLLLETGNVTLDSHSTQGRPDVTPGDYVVLAVTDTGHGMDDATAGRIFEPFYTTKERGAGTGLGLSTVYGIVKQSGGHIDVETERGIGTTFRLYFPEVPGAAEAFSPKPPDERPLTGSETVLLVEDEEAVRRLEREMLETYGYTVLVAGDGAEGLKLAQNHPHPIQLLLTDILMPKMGGVELAERLSKARPELKVLYTSGYNDSGGNLTSVAGARYLQKPYAMEELARTLRDLLDSEDSAESVLLAGRG